MVGKVTGRSGAFGVRRLTSEKLERVPRSSLESAHGPTQRSRRELPLPRDLRRSCCTCADVIVLDPATMPGGYYFAAFKDELERRIDGVPMFHRKLKQVPLGIDHPVWVNDDDFDIDRHVHRMALPSPGGDRELADLCGHMAGIPLDRSRPLWEFVVIEGSRSRARSRSSPRCTTAPSTASPAPTRSRSCAASSPTRRRLETPPKNGARPYARRHRAARAGRGHQPDQAGGGGQARRPHRRGAHQDHRPRPQRYGDGGTADALRAPRSTATITGHRTVGRRRTCRWTRSRRSRTPSRVRPSTTW